MISKELNPSRRTVVKALAGGGLSLAAWWAGMPLSAEAQERKTTVFYWGVLTKSMTGLLSEWPNLENELAFLNLKTAFGRNDTTMEQALIVQEPPPNFTLALQFTDLHYGKAGYGLHSLYAQQLPPYQQGKFNPVRHISSADGALPRKMPTGKISFASPNSGTSIGLLHAYEIGNGVQAMILAASAGIELINANVTKPAFLDYPPGDMA
jgi:hypothetical protein